MASLLVAGVGQQRHVASPLDRLLEQALVLGAGAGDTPGKDLGALEDVGLEQAHVLVVDVRDLVDTELADFAPAEER